MGFEPIPTPDEAPAPHPVPPRSTSKNALRAARAALVRAARATLPLAWLQPWSAILVMRAASRTAEGGGLAALVLAEKMTAGAFSLIAVPVTALVYPALAGRFARGEGGAAKETVRKTLLTAVAGGCFLALAFAVGAPLLTDWMLRARPASAERIREAIRVLACGLPLSAASCVLGKAAEAGGSVRNSVLSRAAGAAFTALAAGLFGRMLGLPGAALAEVLGQAATLVVLLAGALRQTKREVRSVDPALVRGD